MCNFRETLDIKSIKHNFKKRRVIKKLLYAVVFLIVLVFLSGFLYVRTHLKNIIQEIVQRETSNQYKIDFSSISVNVLDARITLADVALIPTEKRAHTTYELHIPAIYLDLASWRPILFQKKIQVDSLRMDKPNITIYHYANRSQESSRKFELGKFYENLRQATATIGVKSLDLKHTTIRFESASNIRMEISDFDVTVRNFAETADKTFLSSSEFILEMRPQTWHLSPGHEVSFKRLYFSGEELSIDTCLVHLQADSTAVGTTFSAEQLKLRIKNPSSLYKEQIVEIDSVLAKFPVLNFGMKSRAARKRSAKRPDLDQALTKLFGPISCHFASIEKGRIKMNVETGENDSYASTQTDVKIHGLHVNPTTKPHLSIEKIDLLLNEITFSTPDSLYQLAVDEFGFVDNDLVARKAALNPTSMNKSDLRISADVPLLKLSDISLMDLVQKRFVASQAWIESPKIVLTANRNSVVPKKADSTSHDQDKGNIGATNFYETLKILAQLVRVDILYINKGYLDYLNTSGRSAKLRLRELDLQLLVNELLRSNSPLAIKKSIPHLRIGKGVVQSGESLVMLENLLMTGTRQVGSIKNARVAQGDAFNAKLSSIFWSHFSWDSLVQKNQLVLDSLSIGSLSIWGTARNRNSANNKNGSIPMHVRLFRMNHFDVNFTSKSGLNVIASGNGLKLAGLVTKNESMRWSEMKTGIRTLSISKGNTTFSTSDGIIDLGNESNLTNVGFKNSGTNLHVPLLKFDLTLNNDDLSTLDLGHLTMHQPAIEIKKAKEPGIKRQDQGMMKPIMVNLQKLNVLDGRFGYVNDSISVTSSINLNGDNLHFKQSQSAYSTFDQIKGQLDNVSVDVRGTPTKATQVVFTLSGGRIVKEAGSKTSIHSIISAAWQDFNLQGSDKQNSMFKLSNFDGKIQDYTLDTKSHKERIRISEIIQAASISAGSVLYSDSNQILSVGNVQANASKGTVELDEVSVTPTKSRGEFFRTQSFQKDYLLFRAEKIRLEDFQTVGLLNDTILEVRKVTAHKAFISSARDKTMKFLHGFEKHMPTKLISRVGMPIKIDTIELRNASVDVHEISSATKKEGIIPITHINGYITNVTNNKNEYDSLRILATGQVIDYQLRRFHYAESYADSLSGFRMSYRLSPMNLTKLSSVTVPLASVSITRGNADTLYARMSGNKHGAYGIMNFHYQKLKIRILDKKDTVRKTLLLSFENFLANNLLLKTKNRKRSTVFFMRNKEKFVFNYWVKSLFSGILTSAGIKKNRKYRRMHEAYKQQYSLPL